ncbi:DUF2628 domain-containing protein [Virgibacillus soli]
MICSRCKTENSHDGFYCAQCGYPLEKTIESNIHTQDDSGNSAEIKDKELFVHQFEEDVRLFVGKKADLYEIKWEKASKKNGLSFNFAAFFFSLFWLGYRKMYKPIIFILLGFLGIDILLYFLGYEYSMDLRADPIDYAIQIGVSVLLGLYGNALYEKRVQQQVKLIRHMKPNQIDRETLYKENGGTSWLGIIFSAVLIFLVYGIPSYFLPIHINSIDTIKYSHFEDSPEITIEELFDYIFTTGSWEYTNKNQDTDHVDFHGMMHVDNEKHDVLISFYNDRHLDTLEVTTIYINGEELYEEDANDFLDYLFYLYSDMSP